jgi:2-C-methyl-D-erythritol 4-phosphate cytidylyltransferase
MQRELAKPFIRLGDKTILGHTLSKFLSLNGLQQIVVATSSEYLDRASSILEDVVGQNIAWNCVEGGAERQESVHKALQAVGDVDLVLVHDAVRPFVELDTINACCKQAEQYGAAIPGIPSKDTLKKIDEDRQVLETPDRKFLWQVQTPQVFQLSLLKKAYEQAAKQQFVGTDDASLVEWLGEPVKVVEGSPRNIKITYPQDLQLAQLLLKKEHANE